jgi:tape measure domain-containing protein
MNAYEYIVRMKDYASSGLRQIAASAGVTDTRLHGVEKRSTSVSRFLGGSFMSVLSRVALGFGVMTAASALFFKGVDFEQTKVKFEVLLGSVEKGMAMFNELNEFANFTPFSNNAVIKASETMLGFGVAQEKILPNMKMLGDVSMGNEQKLGSISLAFSQIMATGRLMGQDLLQLINQGFNPLQIISENTGVSMGDLKKQMEKGAISAGMVEEAFRLATSEGGRYHGMTERMAESAGGKWSEFMGKLQFVIAKVGEKFATWLIPMIDIGIAVVENIIPFGKAIFNLIGWVSQATPLLITLGAVGLALGLNYVIANASFIAFTLQFYAFNAATWLATVATTGLSTAVGILNFIMAMNPISLVIIGIGLLVGAVVLLWNKVDWLRGGIMGIGEVMIAFGSAIKNLVINRIKELLSGITGLGKMLMAFFKGDFKDALEYGKQASKDLLGIGSGKQFIKDGLTAAKSFSEGYKNGIKIETPKTEFKKTGAVAETKSFLTKEPSAVFADLLKNKKEADKKKKAKTKADAIVSGGSKQTHINVTIQKLQDDTKIYVSSAEKGIQEMGDKIQEQILRAVNSVNQMQTQ